MATRGRPLYIGEARAAFPPPLGPRAGPARGPARGPPMGRRESIHRRTITNHPEFDFQADKSMFIGRVVRGVDLNAFLQPEGMHCLGPPSGMPFQRHLLNPARLEFPSTSKLLIIHAVWIDDGCKIASNNGLKGEVEMVVAEVVSVSFFPSFFLF